MKIKLLSRLMKRQKMALLLNVVCLSIAFAIFFIVLRQVRYDFSYDTSYPESENIYRMGYYDVAGTKYSASMSMPIWRQIMDPLPEVTAYTILWISTDEKSTFYYGEEEYKNIPFYGVTPGFFEIFQPRIIAGDAIEAIKNKSGLVIPQSMAEKWFGNENPIGKSLGWGNKNNLWTVKAVYEDFPENSTMRNAVILKMNENNEWSEWSYNCFCRVAPGTDGKQLEKKVIAMVDSLYMKESNGELRFSDRRVLRLSSMKDLYFDRDIENTLSDSAHGNLSMTWCLLAIGVLIILVAYINFINFSTALAPSRIGVLNLCKISGASSMELKKYILTEAVLLSFMAWILSFFWVWAFSATALAREYFMASLSPLDNIGFYMLLGVGSLIAGVIAGLYPAYYITSFQPALVLKGSFAMSGSGRRLRNSLLIFQFIVTICLVIASLFIVIQHHYLRDLPWGYQRENIVYVSTNDNIEETSATFRSELMKNPDVMDVTASRFIPGNVPMGWGREYKDGYIQFFSWPVAPNFLSFFGIPVYDGDTLRIPPVGVDYAILNRKMVEKFNLQKEIGQSGFRAFQNPVTILGFAENVNFASLHNEIEPMAFICGDDMWNNYIFMKIGPERIPETIGYIKNCFAKYGIKECDVRFLDDYINSLYRQEESLAQLISLFCLITVLISLAGIYGLILFNIRYKVKEVGIRKINGAESGQVLWMLNRIFVRLVGIGFLIAVPLAWFLVNGWLKGYPYHTPIHWWVFLLALLVTLMVTLLTVSWQSWKAANANPIDAIKTE